MVLSNDAITNAMMNIGTVFRIRLPTEWPGCCTDAGSIQGIVKLKRSTIGMMSVVRVSLTMVAKLPAGWLYANPDATTADVSLTAVPAHIPKPWSLSDIK